MKGEIVHEHCGSSVAFVTAIGAMRNKLNNIWQQLKSKNNLKSRSIPTEAGLCLLICSIFPNDSRIPIEDLVIYGMGLSMFQDVHSLIEARRRVYDLIKIINDLKYPPKVIGSKIRFAHEKDNTRRHFAEMLVGGRELAKLIASSYPLVFLQETIKEELSQSNWCRHCYGLSLVLKKVKEYHVNLKCPKLALLQLHYTEDSQRIPVDFFDGMKKLCVLSLDIPSLPQSLNMPRSLRTLRLKVLKFEDASSIGGLVDLEFLSVSVPSLTDVPMEMGKLENLKLLDIREMNIQYIPPGVLSRLLKLEELYLPLSFKGWGCKAKKYDDSDLRDFVQQDNYDDGERISAYMSEINDEERINASLSDLRSLSLNALQISVPKASLLPKKSMIFKRIQQFKILIRNDVHYQPFEKDSINEMQLTVTGEACDIKESGICDLMSRTEDLSLIGVRNLKNVMYQLEDNGFPQLKNLIIAECDELEYVVDTTKKLSLSEGCCFFKKLECLHLSMLCNLKEICDRRLTSSQWLPNLSQISIRFCHKLKYVFPLSIVKGSMLKSVEVLDCNEMEGIFYDDNKECIPVKLCTIEKLELHSLPKMISLLLNEVRKDTDQSLTTYKEDFVSHMVIECAFPSKLAEKCLQNLKRLKIAFCDAVQVIFLFEENHATSRAFNSLKELELHGLPNLAHIWFHIPPKITTFQNLQLLVLSECNNLYLFSRQVAKLLVQLERVYVSRCEMMEEIILKDEKEVKGKILFPRLQLLELQRIPNLRAFSCGIYEIELPLLQSLKFNECNKMEYFSNGVSRTPMLERIEVNGRLCSLIGDLNRTMKRLIDGQFSYADLESATMSWGPESYLGSSDFGEVYLGWIDEKTFAPSRHGTGKMVSVNILNSYMLQGFEEWQVRIDPGARFPDEGRVSGKLGGRI